jgi:hypothetical protein
LAVVLSNRALQCALITIMQTKCGYTRAAITVTTRVTASGCAYIADIPPRYRPEVYAFLAQHPQFRLVKVAADPLILSREQAAAVIKLAHEAAALASALE